MGHGGTEYSKLDFAWEKLDNIIDLQERWMVICYKKLEAAIESHELNKIYI
jgi:hypothetical protein